MCIRDRYSAFLSTLGEQSLQRLQYYERSIRERDKPLYEALPQMADKAAQLISQHFSPDDYKDVLLTGRNAGNMKEGFSEADLALRRTDKDDILLSLKFGKYGSFVNTKSGGLRSFLQKYFSLFSSSQLDQHLSLIHISEPTRPY